MFYEYYTNQIEQLLEKKFPKFLAEPISGGLDMLLHRLLDLNVLITKKYTNPRYYEEINGIAKGSGMAAMEISRLNIFP